MLILHASFASRKDTIIFQRLKKTGDCADVTTDIVLYSIFNYAMFYLCYFLGQKITDYHVDLVTNIL